MGDDCATHMEVLADKVIAGKDYQWFAPNTTDPSSCIAACCGDSRCKAWALEDASTQGSAPCTKGGPCCWLKTGGSPQPKMQGQSQVAVGVRPGSDADQCITVQDRQSGERAATLKLEQCGPLPQSSQQFQFDEITGALRMKGGGCVQSHGDACGLNYRDCCLGVCKTRHDFVV